MRHQRLLGLAALTLAVPVALSGCRTPRRAVRVGAETSTLKVAMTNLASTDTNRSDFIYEISGCISPLNGNLSAPTEASFTAVGLKLGLAGCQLKVKSLAAIPGVAFAANSEPGVLYWTRELSLSQDASGALSAVADLQKLYTVTSTSSALFTLAVPVTFSEPEKGQVVTAGIKCSPEILTTGLFERTSDTAGTFTFKTELAAEAAYVCTELSARIDGAVEARHTGTFAADTGTFTAKPGETFQTGPLALTKVAVTPPSTGVDVSTKGENCNEDGKVYDPETRTCETAP
jgi:hypothetical protein